MAHTPGPWIDTNLLLGSDGIRGWEVWGDLDAQGKYQNFVAMALVFQGIGEDEAHQNARLIAAAPDLLTACRKFIEWHEQDLGYMTDDGFYLGWDDLYDLREAVDDAKAAIAKAQGDDGGGE